MTTELPLAYADFTADQYPIHITLYRGESVVWEAHLRGPGALEIPKLGGITRCLVELGDGSIHESTV